MRLISTSGKLESALAADAQRRSLDSHASESEYSDTRSGPRSRRRGSRPSSRQSKADRFRNITPISTGHSTPKNVSDDSRPPKEKKKATVEPAETTPSKAHENGTDIHELRTIPSVASLTALRPDSPSVASPITPSLTTTTSIATDDEDTDFQSAYSTSPRGSYHSFENFAAKKFDSSESDSGTPTSADTRKGHLDDGRNSRERASSTATAKDTMSRYSQDTVTSPVNPPIPGR